MQSRYLFILFALFPHLASAQNLFNPVPNDKSIEMLAAMFGGLGVFGTSSSDAFMAVITAFNGAVLIVGGVLVAYTIFAGTIGTAHEGEMLGKKFSSVWIPIRTALGTAMVLPVINGYCVMQLLVGWLIVQGIGLADTVWSAYMSSSNIAKQVTIGLENQSQQQAAWEIFNSVVCMRGYEKIYQEAQASSPGIWPVVLFGTSEGTNLNGDTIIKFGSTNEISGFKSDSCGSVTVGKTQDFTTLGAASSSGGSNQITKILGDVSTLNSAVATANLTNKTATYDMIKSIDSLAISFINNPTTNNIESQIKSIAVDYSKTMKQAGSAVMSQLANFQELEKSATKDGWVLAGAWYMRMSYLMDVAGRAINSSPETSTVQALDKVNTLFRDTYVQKFGNDLNRLSQLNNGVTGVSSSINQSDNATGGVWDMIKSGFNFDTIVKRMFKGITNFTFNDGDHPVMAMKSVGNWALAVAAVAYKGYATGITALSAATQGAGVGLAIALLPITMIVFPTLMIVGFTLSIVLPMMPFMIWIGIVLGWLILCVEALIAAPMWAVMHLSPHGDDLVGTGSQGYRLVLSLMLRPVLMIFGLIAALTIITVFGQMLNRVFFDVFILSQQDSNVIVLVVSFLAAPLIYMGLMWTLITKTMSITHIIPDQLLQWFGGGGSQLGNYGETMGSHGSNTYVAAASFGQMGGKGIEMQRQAKDLALQADQSKQLKANQEQQGITNKNNNAKAIDGKIGDGGATVVSKALSSIGADPNDLDSLAAQRITSSMKQVTDALGGPNTADSQRFIENMNQDLDAGMSFGDAYKKNTAKALNSKYGNSASMVADIFSNGTFSGSGYKQAIEKMGAISNMYSNLGPVEQREKSSALMAAAIHHFETSQNSIQNGGSNDFTHYVDKAMDYAIKNSNSAVITPSTDNQDGKTVKK